MIPFFIVGLPRSRTAWLANLFTDGQSHCYHEALKEVGVDGLVERFVQFQCAGEAGAAALLCWRELNAEFPDAKWVFVERNAKDCLEAHNAAFPDNHISREKMANLENEIKAAKKDIGLRAIGITYEGLDTFGGCNVIFQYVTGRPLSHDRWQLLNELRVTVFAEKTLPAMNPNLRRVALAVYPPTELHLQYMTVLRQICGENVAAYSWLNDVMNVAMTWDHIVDGDAVDVACTHAAFEAMLTQWPQNPFWQKFALYLVPVLSNAIGSWKCEAKGGNGYAVYTDVVFAVAFLLGGPELRDKFSGVLYALVGGIRHEDNCRDKEISR